MKEIIFSFVWAALCAWAIVHWVLVPLNDEFHLTSAWFFPAVMDCIHGWGWTGRRVAFFTLFAIFMLTDFHRILGTWLLVLIGVVCFLFLVWIVISVGGIFLTWLVGTL